MSIAVEKIQKMKEALNSIDKAVFRLTDIFFVNIYKPEVPKELLDSIHTYIIQMSLLIPEIRAYLDLMEKGIFDKIDLITDRFKLMEEYVSTTEEYCEELLLELGLK